MRSTITRFTTVVAALFFAAPLAAVEAQAGKVFRTGYLSFTNESGQPYIRAFRQGLLELGHVEGQNVALEIRSGDGRPERYPGLAAELVRVKADLILTGGNPAIEAAHKATTSIPIVMVAASDPVASGFVASLARPGGNITGLTTQAPDVAGKALQLLKEAVPQLSRVAVLWDPGLPGGRQTLSEVEAAAPVLGLQLHALKVRNPGELDGAFAAAARNRAGAAFISAGNTTFFNRVRVAELAVTRRLPTIGIAREYAEAGCLIGYGASVTDQFRRAAYLADKILKGAKAADLPVEQPTKFYFAIKLKTAKALGLSIPQPLLLRADQVIEQ
jgi:putative tryptophan/tyrosine transport system substrate-binding protein